MGTRPRQRPQRLAAKLLAIRKKLRLSQSQLALRLEFDRGSARISEYENDQKEPELELLLRYARLAKVCTCVLIDDAAKLTSRFHKQSRK